eukprot:TRINITY_DN15270_c0_g1_i1.p1 TRINITY_DN15270_c0_g1~~TRINITY_DN15270_c0_g1_i1.p1  ORF type:complete len:391 (+),score=73.70 TRINITY_DN15270_c0_g1_i1:103-1173(+)
MELGYHQALQTALKAAYSVLCDGGTAVAATEAAVKVMEDSPLFNAGKGAVFTHDGKIEFDASIMDGATLAAGAIAAVPGIRNPITLARHVMVDSPHVLLCGVSALEFARLHSVAIEPQEYFETEHRRVQWQHATKPQLSESAASAEIPAISTAEMTSRSSFATEITAFPSSTAEITPIPSEITHLASSTAGIAPIASSTAEFPSDNKKFGTVGCVALDQHGNLAAATSTGGMTSKRYGRIGDSAVIGAGTYADNHTAAVSCTGHGEYFIRVCCARDVCAQMEYGQRTLHESVQYLIQDKLKRLGGEGGLVAVNAAGEVEMQMNSSGMYRGMVGREGKIRTAIYADDAFTEVDVWSN